VGCNPATKHRNDSQKKKKNTRRFKQRTFHGNNNPRLPRPIFQQLFRVFQEQGLLFRDIPILSFKFTAYPGTVRTLHFSVSITQSVSSKIRTPVFGTQSTTIIYSNLSPTAIQNTTSITAWRSTKNNNTQVPETDATERRQKRRIRAKRRH